MPHIGTFLPSKGLISCSLFFWLKGWYGGGKLFYVRIFTQMHTHIWDLGHRKLMGGL